MRVIINHVSTLGNKAGIGHYVAELVRSLSNLPACQVQLFPTGWVNRVVDLYVRRRHALENGLRSSTEPLGRAQCLRHGFSRGLHQAAFWALGRQFRARCRHYHLYHEPNTIPLPCDAPTVSTIHDLSLLLYPDWHTPDRVAHFEKNLRRALGQVVHFFTDSDFIRRQVIGILGVPAQRITRIYLGVRSNFRRMPAHEVQEVLRQLGLPASYLLCVSTIEPRKNLLMLLQVYCSLPRELRERWPLVLVGKWGWNCHEVADFLNSTARHEGVHHLGYLADGHLAAIYNGARALLYPSHYEGFGLPPLEMLACGGAVLASSTGAVNEIVGQHAHFIEPHDSDGWRTALMRVVSDDDWWQSLREGGMAHAATFDWGHFAQATLSAYDAVLRPSQTTAHPAA